MKHLSLLLLSTAFIACQHSGKSTGMADSTANSDMNVDTAAWATYSGTLPCADCEGIVTELSLERKQDHHFNLKETYLGKNLTFPSEGIYNIVHGSPADPGATVIQLNPDKDRNLQRFFQQIDNRELKLLDANQKTIEGNRNYSLKRVI